MTDVSTDEIFIPLTLNDMPTERLKDVFNLLENKQPSVLNLDACITGPLTIRILRTLLLKIDSVRSLKTLSLRFNNLGDVGAQYLSSWLSTNDFLEVIYLLGTGIIKIELVDEAWRKNLIGHKVDNNGYTFIRVAEAPPAVDSTA